MYNYDKEKYIKEGFILPDGTMLTDKYAKKHIEMAKKYVSEHYSYAFNNSIIKDEQDYMIMKLGALQIMSYKRPIILFCEMRQNRFIQEAIASYLTYGWEQQIVQNPYSSYNDYFRYNILKEEYLFSEKYNNQYKLKKNYHRK